MRGVDARERDRQGARGAARWSASADAFDKKPHQLSGGQRQRVALARALVVEPAVLLLDEPLGALDLKLRRQMQDELKAIQKRVGTAFVHVTHDQEEAMALADHCVVMNDGPHRGRGPARARLCAAGDAASPPPSWARARSLQVGRCPGPHHDSARRLRCAGPGSRQRGLHRHQAGARPCRAGHPRNRDGRGLPGQLQAGHGDADPCAGHPFAGAPACRDAGRGGRQKSRFASILPR